MKLSEISNNIHTAYKRYSKLNNIDYFMTGASSESAIKGE